MSRADLKQFKMPTSLPPHLIVNLSAQGWHPRIAGRKGSGGVSLHSPPPPLHRLEPRPLSSLVTGNSFSTHSHLNVRPSLSLGYEGPV